MSDGGPGLLAAGLLGREVGGGAEHRADLGDARLLGRLGDAEVGELDGARSRSAMSRLPGFTSRCTTPARCA